MKKLGFCVLQIITMVLLISCGATISQFEMQEPEEGNSVVVGAVLVENNGIDDLYQSKTANIIAIVVGRHMEDGKEKIIGYRLKTDQNGYFFIPNIKPGAYVLKGIEFDIGYSGRMMISSRWDGPKQIYLPENLMIDYVVREWPDDINERVIDLGINYFMVDLSYRVYNDLYGSLSDNVLSLEQISHTMSNPKTYYRDKYPEINCFK